MHHGWGAGSSPRPDASQEGKPPQEAALPLEWRHLRVELRLADEGGLEQEVASACAWIGWVQRSLNTDGGSSRGGYCFFLSFLNLLEKKEIGLIGSSNHNKESEQINMKGLKLIPKSLIIFFPGMHSS